MEKATSPTSEAHAVKECCFEACLDQETRCSILFIVNMFISMAEASTECI